MPRLPFAALLTSAALVVSMPSSISVAANDFAFEASISQTAMTERPLLDIARAGDRLVATGERGLIIISDDQGKSWRQITVPVSTTLTALSFPDERNGWAAGHAGTILHTSDGGESWSLQFDGNQANSQFLVSSQAKVAQLQQELEQLAMEGIEQQALDDLQYTLEDAEFAVEDAQLAVDTGPADPFLDILMFDSQQGFAVGAYGMIYRTSDGGESWQLSSKGIDNSDRFHYYAMTADTLGNLYLSGEAGLLYFSHDNGESWQQVEGLYDGSLFGLVSQGDATIAFGLRGNIFRSTDQGRSWDRVETGQNYSLYGGTALESGVILLFGTAGQVLSSVDGGLNFSAYQHPSRSTFSTGIEAPGDTYYLIGMNGIKKQEQLGTQHD